jgi:tetratricopeptide (TPR) repeat protein
LLEGREPLRIFVAMPGTSMGPRAEWDDISEIVLELLEPVRAQLQEQTGRPTTLTIEKEKTAINPIHKSMFHEALTADIYIADLTGANPNVYLELGVRWALRDKVTIPIAQHVDDLRFNVSSTRSIIYGRSIGKARAAINGIVSAAMAGLTNVHGVDNPVRDSLDLITVSRAEFEKLQDIIGELRSQRADDLVELASRSNRSSEALGLLREAIARNPAHRVARYRLGTLLRSEGKYSEAIDALEDLVRLFPDDADGWRELGVAANKNGELHRAHTAFKRSLELNSNSEETWATLGGLLRRLAHKAEAGVFDREILSEAMEAYRKAADLAPHETYAAVNVERIRLLLSAGDKESYAKAQSRLAHLELLAMWATQEEPEDYWKKFDLADTRLLRGAVESGMQAVREGIRLTPVDKRGPVLTSAADPLRDLLSSPGLLDPDAANAVRAAISEYDDAMREARDSAAISPAGRYGTRT